MKMDLLRLGDSLTRTRARQCARVGFRIKLEYDIGCIQIGGISVATGMNLL